MNNKKIAHLLTVFGVIFLSLIIYITVFDLVNHDDYAVTSTSDREDYVRRGSILDRRGTILAQSNGVGKDAVRSYPYKDMYAHIIGYKSDSLGSNEIEKYYNSDLTGKSTAPLIGDALSFLRDVKSIFDGESIRWGLDINLTIDHNLQQTAYSALGNYKGSVVALNPKTGEVLAMVSKPGFDPSPQVLESSIETASKNNDKALLRRATMESYPPGSTFKIIVAASMIENGKDNFVFDDRDELTVKVKNYGEGEGNFIGETDLEKGFINSSNIYFSEAANSLGESKIMQTAKQFMFDDKIKLDRLGVAPSQLPENISSPGDITNLCLGQGDVRATPLHMALIASAIANDGVMMTPYIVDSTSGTGGIRATPTKLKKCTDGYTAAKLKELMKKCVEQGTGSAAAVYGRNVCGKTGTAEVDTEKGTAHALFVGFAPYENPEIAICVVVENLPHKNTGGTVAAPIARSVFSKYFESK